jgi:hypothetical protein
MCGGPQPIFVATSATLLDSMWACIVCMNNEASLASLWAQLDQFCEDIVTIVSGLKRRPFGRTSTK